MYSFSGDVHHHFLIFDNITYQKEELMQVFKFFKARIDDFNIYSSLNQQIFTIIGKLGLKIPNLHTTS
jgi:hypothetical protein